MPRNAAALAKPGARAVTKTERRPSASALFTTVRSKFAASCPAAMTAKADGRKRFVSLKAMEHIKRALEGAVAKESLRLESGLILLSIAVSGAPFLGLLGTVWGVMSAFSYVAMAQKADLATMAPGVSGALITTVAGLLVAIPSMFGYNYLVNSLRVFTVELDNFAQELVSKMETEYLRDEDEL